MSTGSSTPTVVMIVLSVLSIHQETYGKSGCRRIVPGQYVACDPKGRAVMTGDHTCHFDCDAVILQQLHTRTTSGTPLILHFSASASEPCGD